MEIESSKERVIQFNKKLQTKLEKYKKTLT